MNIDLIDLKVDFVFKLIFGRDGQEPVLVAFLNATQTYRGEEDPVPNLH